MMADRSTEDTMGSRVIAVDVGGTFIDIVSIDRETGEVHDREAAIDPRTPRR